MQIERFFVLARYARREQAALVSLYERSWRSVDAYAGALACLVSHAPVASVGGAMGHFFQRGALRAPQKCIHFDALH